MLAIDEESFASELGYLLGKELCQFNSITFLGGAFLFQNRQAS